jgi:hypothetical protein
MLGGISGRILRISFALSWNLGFTGNLTRKIANYYSSFWQPEWASRGPPRGRSAAATRTSCHCVCTVGHALINPSHTQSLASRGKATATMTGGLGPVTRRLPQWQAGPLLSELGARARLLRRARRPAVRRRAQCPCPTQSERNGPRAGRSPGQRAGRSGQRLGAEPAAASSQPRLDSSLVV